MPRLSYFFGYNEISPIPNNPQTYVEIYHWENGPGASAGIVSMKAVCNTAAYTGQEYLHFCPKSMVGVADRSVSNLLRAVEGDFIQSLDDAILIEGLRRKPDLYTKNEFNVMGDNEKLALAKKLIEENKVTEDELKACGKPACIIRLNQLDVQEMITAIRALHQYPPQFSLMSGTYIRDNTANCASIILRVLEIGGAQKLVPPLHVQGTKHAIDNAVPLILILGATMEGIVPGVVASLTVVLGVRALGGAIEGYEATQNQVKLMKKEGQYWLPASLVLHTVHSITSGLLSIITSESPPNIVNVLPDDLINYVDQLKQAERARPAVHLPIDFGVRRPS